MKNVRKKDEYLVVGMPLQSSLLQERAPLCSHEYVSTATLQPFKSLMFIGNIIDFKRGKRPCIPIFSSEFNWVFENFSNFEKWVSAKIAV